MIARLVVWVSLIASLVIVASFGMFAVDQARNGSKQQVAKLNGEIGPATNASTNVNQADPSPKTERARERAHGKVRETIDDVDDVLVSPFAGISSSKDIWVQRGLPSLLALLVFGLGLRLLASYLPGGQRR